MIENKSQKTTFFIFFKEEKPSHNGRLERRDFKKEYINKVNISTKHDYEHENQRPKTDFFPLVHILEDDFPAPSLRQIITIKAFYFTSFHSMA